MKRILLMMLVALSLSVNAQTAKEQKMIQHISKVAAELKSMQGDFVQTKTLKMLGDKMVSKGRMYYQQTNKLRWEYTTPYAYTFILNNNKVLLKKGTRQDVIDVNQNRMFKEIARIMMNCMVGKCLTDQKEFQVSVTEQAAEYVATLVPQKKDMKQMYTRIVLHFNHKTSMVSKVIMYEKNGDNTVIELKNVTANKPVNTNVFSLQ